MDWVLVDEFYCGLLFVGAFDWEDESAFLDESWLLLIETAPPLLFEVLFVVEDESAFVLTLLLLADDDEPDEVVFVDLFDELLLLLLFIFELLTGFEFDPDELLFKLFVPWLLFIIDKIIVVSSNKSFNMISPFLLYSKLIEYDNAFKYK